MARYMSTTVQIDISLIIFLIIVLLTAVIIDMRVYKIPNHLTYPAIAVSIIFHTVLNGSSGFIFSTLGLVVGTGLRSPNEHWRTAMSDSSYIQALIDRGPGVVRLEAEHYELTDPLVVPEGVSLVGKGPGATILLYHGTGTAITLRYNDTTPTDYRRHHGRLADFTLHSDTGRDGIAVKNRGCISLERLRVVGFQLAGLHLATLPGEAIIGIDATGCESTRTVSACWRRAPTTAQTRSRSPAAGFGANHSLPRSASTR